MLAIVILIIIWAFLFAIFEVPARMIGTRLVRKTTPRTGGTGVLQNFFAITVCLMGASLIVMIGAIVVYFGHVGVSPTFDNVYDNDPVGFTFIFAGFFLLVPAFVALLMGYFGARKSSFAAIPEGYQENYGTQDEWLRDVSLNQRTFQEFFRLNRRQTLSMFCVDWLIAIPVWSATFLHFRDDLSLALTVTLVCLLTVHIVRMPKLVHQPNLELSFDQSVRAVVISVGGLAFVVFMTFVLVEPPFNDLATQNPRLYRSAYGTVAISLMLISMLLVLADCAIVSFFRRFRRQAT